MSESKYGTVVKSGPRPVVKYALGLVKRGRKSGTKYASKNFVKRIIAQATYSERNVFYVVQSAYNLNVQGTGGGTVFDVSSMAAGDATSTRTGNQVGLKSIWLSYFLSGSNTSAQTTANPKTRVLLVLDKYSEDDTFTAADLFINIATNSDLFNEKLPQFEERMPKRFKILMDRTHTLRSAGVSTMSNAAPSVPADYVTAETGCQRYFKRFKLGKLIATYNGTASTNNVSNTLYLVFLPQTTVGYVNFMTELDYTE